MSSVSVVIPTWGRERVLVDSVRAVLAQLEPGDELIVVDQTAAHEAPTQRALEDWERAGAVRRVALPRPSIPRAMNAGLQGARSPVVLFLDDDIVPEPGLVAAHRAAHDGGDAALVAGRVLQPWDDTGGAAGGAGSPFTGREPAWVEEFMGGNVSVRRDAALAAGGFDERFVKAAYRFEKEFADRMLGRGNRIRYEPAAGIRHLRAASGGTRALAPRWYNPGHGVGEYYYLLRSPRVSGAPRKVLRRLLGSVATRYHAARPWMAPVTLAAEVMALLWAVALRLRGPRLIPGTGPSRQVGAARSGG